LDPSNSIHEDVREICFIVAMGEKAILVEVFDHDSTVAEFLDEMEEDVNDHTNDAEASKYAWWMGQGWRQV
jgi:hypothetical protein